MNRFMEGKSMLLASYVHRYKWIKDTSTWVTCSSKIHSGTKRANVHT